MSTKAMRSGESARAPAQQSSSKEPKPKVPKQLIERIKEATNATDEVIIHTLEECNYDPNEATTRLIENPFMEFTTKAKRKQQRAADSAKDNKGSVLEVKRSGSVGGNTRGGRGFGRGDRQSVDRVRSGRGAPRTAESGVKTSGDAGWGIQAAAGDGWDEPETAPVAAPSPSRPSASPAAASSTPLPPHPEPARPSWGRPGAPGTGTMADLLKRPPPAATAPPPDGQLPPSAPDEKQEIIGTGSPPGQIPSPQQAQLHDHTSTAASENAPAMPPPDPVAQSLNSLQSGGLQTLSSNSMPSSYPNAPQPIGPPSGSVSHSHTNTQSASQDQPMHKTSTSDLGGVAVDPPVRPSYNPQPQQDLHSNGGPQLAQHDAWGTVSNKPSSAGSGPGQPGAASQTGLSQQGNFGQAPQHQHQGPQQNLGPSLLSSLNGQTSSGPSTSDALHSLGSLSTPALSTSTPADSHAHTNFQQDRTSQYSMLPQVDQLQMQFGQVQLNGNDFNSGFGTGFGPPSSQGQSQDTSSNPLEPDMSFLHSQPSQLQQHSQQLQQHSQQQQQQQQQQPQQQLSQQAGRSGSDPATSTADGLIQQHRPSGSTDYPSSSASRGYGAFPQSHAQPASSRAIPAASQSGPTSVSAGIQTESSSLGDNAGQGYGSYGSAQGMGGFANQQSQHSQTPQYQSYGDSSAGTPTAGVASSKQPAYDGYSNYNSFSSQPSFGGQKADLYSGHSSHGSQPQALPPRYGNQHHASTGVAQSSGLHGAQPGGAATLPHASSGSLSAPSAQSAPQLPQMAYAGPGGLPPSMGQYNQYGGPSQTPSYAPYMNPQAPYFNPSSYGGYHQGSNAYGSGASTGFSGNTGYQHGGHPKYQGYSNQAAGYAGSNGYDDGSSGYGKERDNMYGNHAHAPSHARLPQDPYKAHGGYNHTYQQPGHSAYGHQGQFGGYGQNQHTPAPYAPHSNALNGGGFGRLS